MPTAPDLQGDFTSDGHKFVGKRDGGTGFTHGVNGDTVGTVASRRDPLLGPLRNNGGQTDTHALLAGSPAIRRRQRRSTRRSAWLSRLGVADIGPSLGISGQLANPQSELIDGAGDRSRSTRLAGRAQSAGAYHVIVRGAGPATGVALVEVYALE